MAAFLVLSHKSVIHKFTKDFIYHKENTDNSPAFTCSMLTIETLEQDVKYVQS